MLFCEDKGVGNHAGCCSDYASGSGCWVRSSGCEHSDRARRKIARTSTAGEMVRRELPHVV
jgi:hypothetical protein